MATDLTHAGYTHRGREFRLLTGDIVRDNLSSHQLLCQNRVVHREPPQGHQDKGAWKLDDEYTGQCLTGLVKVCADDRLVS